MSRIPSTDKSTWSATFKVGDRVKVRIDFEDILSQKNYTPDDVFTIVNAEKMGSDAVRPENPSGILYYLDNGQTWEGKDLELAEGDFTTAYTPEPATKPISTIKSSKKESSILVELGLSKSQIKQLPKSIVDEAEILDGVRNIVATMPSGVRQEIMQQSIIEAIEIFKNNLLEQDEVELTEEQKKEIEDYKSKEEEERDSRRDEESEDDEKPSDEQDKKDDEESKDDEDSKDEEDTKKRRDEEEDEDKKGSKSKDDKKDQGGEDIPKSKGGGGGGSGGGQPIDIDDDEYPIEELSNEIKDIIKTQIFENRELNLSPSYKSTRWDKENHLFFNLTLEQFLYSWILLSQNTLYSVSSLFSPNLFSLMKYIWEWNKGYEAKVLDRYYIYSQYVPFLMFVAASPHVHSGAFYRKKGWTTDAAKGQKMGWDTMRIYPIPDYSYGLNSNGYYIGQADEQSYNKFDTILNLHIPYLEYDEKRLNKIVENPPKDTTPETRRYTYYTNNFRGNSIVIENTLANDYGLSYYYERYKNINYSLPEVPQDEMREVSLIDGKVVPSGFTEPIGNSYYSKFYGGEDKWFIKLDKERAYKLIRILHKFYNASSWVGHPYDLSYFNNINSKIYKVNVSKIYDVLRKYLTLNSADNLTFSISEVFDNCIVVSNEGGELNLREEKEHQSLGVSYTNVHLKESSDILFPFPEIYNSLEWIKVSSIKIQPKSEPTKKTRKKREYSSEQQEILDEINALKQAIKYTSGEEKESIKQEIEALKQSIKYL